MPTTMLFSTYLSTIRIAAVFAIKKLSDPLFSARHKRILFNTNTPFFLPVFLTDL